MAAKQKVTVSTRPTNPAGALPLNDAPRRSPSLSTKQAELKREAAERRAERAEEPSGPVHAAQVGRCETQQHALIG